MHFSLPDTQEITDEVSKTSYHVYNIHINGVFHCMLRYSQLYDLNEKLRLEYGSNVIPAFPPKKFFSLSESDIEERRKKLEEYIQEIGQNPVLCDSSVLSSFLQMAQQETRLEETVPVSIDIYFANRDKVSIDIDSTDQTEDILENLMSLIGLSEDFVYYFGLFLMRIDDDGTWSFVRILQDFESPYISLKCLKNRPLYKILVHTLYWDHALDKVLCSDNVGLNLLFLQTQHDIFRNWIETSEKVRNKLNLKANKNLRLDYIHLSQSQKNYGFLKFNSCKVSCLSVEGEGIVALGNFEFKLHILDDDGNNIKLEKSFPVTKIRSWRVASPENTALLKDSDQPLLQLGLEVLIKKGKLVWILIYSDQAIMMSMCIKSMVSELLRKRNNEPMKKPSDRSKRKRYAFKARDKFTESLFIKNINAPQPPPPNKSTSYNSLTSDFSEPSCSIDSLSINSDINSIHSDNFTFINGIGDDDL